MQIESTFTSTPRMVLRSYRACARRAYVGRVVLAIGLVVVGAVTQRWMFAALGFAYFVGQELWVRRQLHGYLQGDRQVTIRISDDAYESQGPDRTNRWAWTEFVSAARYDEFWVLRVDRRRALSVPVGALTHDQALSFEQLLRAKGLLA